MSRARSRLATFAATAAVLAVIGCGGSSTGAADTPKGELVAGFDHLADSDVLTTTLRLDATATELQELAKVGGGKVSDKVAEAVSSARVVMESKGSGDSKAFALRADTNGTTLLELRVVSGSLFLQGDLKSAFALADQEKVLTNLQAEAANLPPFVQAFVAGNWVSLNKDALSAIAGQSGLGSSTPSAGPQLLDDLRDILDRDVTVTRAGADETGDHLVLTGNPKKLLDDLKSSVQSSVPGGSALGDQLSPSDLPSQDVTLDAWVKGGTLRQLSLDLAQFDDKGELPAGTELPLVLTFEETGADIAAPADATPIDLAQIGSLIGALTGARSA